MSIKKEFCKKRLAQNMKALRESKNLTMLDLANEFDLHKTAVSRWEKGEVLPRVDLLYIFCQYFNVTLDDLVHAKFLNPKH
jgi:transcriptional regulator with XRE-family HTH domain